MAAQPNAPPDRQSQALETPFSLAPSIFTTFSALSKEPQPTVQEEKIARILQNLTTQHEAVRRNMLWLLKARSRELMQIAEDELAKMGDEGEDKARDEADERENESKRSRDEMLRSVKVKAKEGAKVGDYEVKPGEGTFTDGTFTDGMSNAAQPGTGDVIMGGTDQRPSPRTAHQIRTGLSQDLVSLVERGVYELQAYDSHAAESIIFYKQALERRKDRLGSLSSVSSAQTPAATSTALGDGGGILRH